ncbi:hypothetical protein BDP27DRAFT_1424739 [Rhodocollybia butyracea]|uniref:Uncharacterized protein n=1 Tax=Rhodocollybia butyracea TaxID=206335 RepID=A0A9P5U3B3_9AGAR|nr:hypothetical protein BDP27DRAFT_1424739 [Rhodocollybia butyracea]
MSAAISADYDKVKSEALAELVAYDKYYPSWIAKGRYSALFDLAATVGDSFARLVNFRPQLVADTDFHNSVFLARQKFESLEKVYGAAKPGETMEKPACYTTVKNLTGWIHQVRESSTPDEPATSVAAAINSISATPNADSGTVKPKGGRNRKRTPKSATIVDDNSSDEDLVSISAGDVVMGDSTLSALRTTTELSVDEAMPGATVTIEEPAPKTKCFSFHDSLAAEHGRVVKALQAEGSSTSAEAAPEGL